MNTRWVPKSVLMVSLVALLLLPMTTARAGTDILFETFNDNKINPELWETMLVGNGPTVAEQNQRLEIKLPVDSSGELFVTGYRSRFMLRGNFDIYVDFRLLTWPLESGVRVGMGSFVADPPEAVVERIGFGSSDMGNGEVYLVHTTDSILGFKDTSDRVGKLRLYRRGDVVRAYYYDRADNTWRAIATTDVTTKDLPVVLAAWSHDWAFAGEPTLIAFDNFTIRIGTLVW